MIKLTWMAGKDMGDIYLPENVVIVETNGKATVTVPGIEGHWEIQESPEEVARKVLEYRLMVLQYPIYLSKAQETDEWTRTQAIRKGLKELAGLAE